VWRVFTWLKTDHVGAPPPTPPGKTNRDDVDSISKMILFDDHEHFGKDIKNQRRFAPTVFTIDWN
jgi:hypothetical protein